MSAEGQHKPPKRQPGWGKGPRRLSGALLDVRTVAEFLGESELSVRSQINRGLLPHRRLGARIVIPRGELENFLSHLPGISAAEAAANITKRRAE